MNRALTRVSVPSPRGVTRRQLLVGCLLPLAGSGVLLPVRDGSNSVVRWMRRLFPDFQALAAAGRLYLEDRPEEKSIGWLGQTLFGSEFSIDADEHRQEMLLARVRAARAADFCNDHLVVLNGWAVARTEARLLALLSLCGPAD